MKKSIRMGCTLLLVAWRLSTLHAATSLALQASPVKILPIDSLYIQGYNSQLLSSFYKTHDYKTVWIDKTATRKFLLSTLKACTEEGLDAKEYALDKLNDYEVRFDQLPDSLLVDYDVLLTLKTQKYVAQMSNGRLSPTMFYKDWDIHENKIDINAQLQLFEKGDSLSQQIDRLKPNHAVYKSLKKMLQLLDQFPPDTIECISISKILLKHDHDTSLINIKKRLIYWKDLDAATPLTDDYDDATFQAVKRFQTRHGIAVDGHIGRITVDAMNYSKNRRREQVLCNLERWKWFPRNLGDHYFIINIPEYNLKVVKNNDTIEIKKVVVGQIARRTPVLSSTFNNIILNPTWTVPPTILEEDVLPAALKNRNYFSKKQIVIYDKYNRKTSAWGWNPDKYKDYRYVQDPGDENSLGNVKFNFPNRYSVYLHDTNHRDFFVKNFRSLSSGCIRLENPLPLAEYMLDDAKKWSMEKICDIIFSGKTTAIPLKQRINIHQWYWTSWLDPDGIMQFRTDIYNLDDELADKLGY